MIPIGRWCAGACALVFAAFSWASGSQASVRLSTSVVPAKLTFPRQRTLTYRLTMTTGSQEERLAVGLNRIPFANAIGRKLEGPARYRPNANSVHGDPALYPRECPRHHLDIVPSFPADVIDLPPRSTSILVAKYRLAAAPWPHTDLRMHYGFGADSSFSSDPSAPLTFTSPDLFSPRPVLAGARGVHITLATRPGGYKTNAFPRVPLPHINLGRSVAVRGRTDPAVAGDRIVIRATRWPNGPHPFTIGRPLVDAHGRFSMRWRPRHRRTYGIYAIYRSQHPTLSDDSTPCNQPIRVR